MNIALLPQDQRYASQRDTVASLWAHNVKTKHESKSQVLKKIRAIKDEAKRADMLERFTKYMNA